MSVGCLAMLTGGAAFAQSDELYPLESRILEEIIVTAQKREQDLRDVPISIAVIDGQKISDNAILELEDLSAQVPGFTVTEAAISTLVYVRGLGSGINQGFEQSVGMYIDGVYAGRGRQFRSSFLDIERVELLKGPQGILFGKNSIAGAINITTAQPTDNFEGYVSGLAAAEHGERNLTAVFSGPLGETLAGRIAVKTGGFDGWLNNSVTGRDEAGVDETTARGSLRWTPNDNLEVTGKVEVSKYEVTGRTTQITDAGDFGPLYTFYDPAFEDRLNKHKSVGGIGLDHSNTRTTNAALTIDYGHEDYTFISITGYTEYNYLDKLDVDFGPLPYLFQTEPQDFEQFSQEFRLVSPLNGRFEFVAGAYFENAKLENQKALDGDLSILGIPLPPTTRFVGFDQKSDSWAVFGQGTVHLRDDLRLNLGIRYTDEKKTASQNLWFADFQTTTPNPELGYAYGLVGFGIEHDYRQSRKEDNISPLLSIQWDSSDSVSWYGSAAKGFKAGGFNEAEVTGDITKFEFENEESTTFEIGAKTRLAEGAARLDVALFHTQFDNLQVSAFEGVSFVVGNAARATSKGIEVEGEYLLTDHLSISGSMTYLDSTYDSFKDASCTIAQTIASGAGQACTQDLSGKTTQYAPRFSANINLTWQTIIGSGQQLLAQLSAYHTEGYYLDEDLDRAELQNAYQKYGLRISWTSADGLWNASMLGKNLTNVITKNHGSDVPLLAGAHYSTTDRLRSFALQLTRYF
jgi:iron complex outermembrane receptor protein